MKWVYNDGGRFAAGYQYHVNDCVCRALSIVTERPYREVQRTLKTLDAVNPRGRGGYPQYLTSLGFEWFPCTDIVHFSADELPQGRIVVQMGVFGGGGFLRGWHRAIRTRRAWEPSEKSTLFSAVRGSALTNLSR